MCETFSRQSIITIDQSATVGDMRRHRSYGFQTASFFWYGQCPYLVWTSMDKVNTYNGLRELKRIAKIKFTFQNV